VAGVVAGGPHPGGGPSARGRLPSRGRRDVFATEPLSPESPLWELPNVLVTPHSKSTALGENEALVELFCDNLRRYLAGEALRNVFDRGRGY
jgi:phosphoglycerate dehydrogenase-like enzyme